MEKSLLIHIEFNELREIIYDAVDSCLLNHRRLASKEIDGAGDKGGLLTPLQAAQVAQVSKPTLRSWESRGIIKGHRVGRKVYYSQSELLEAIKGAR